MGWREVTGSHKMRTAGHAPSQHALFRERVFPPPPTTRAGNDLHAVEIVEEVAPTSRCEREQYNAANRSPITWACIACCSYAKAHRPFAAAIVPRQIPLATGRYAGIGGRVRACSDAE